MTCTLVTAYYDIKSKFPKDHYVSWMTTFLKIKAPIVLFTEEHMVSTIQALREDRPIHIIVMPFEELDAWKLYKDKWIAQSDMDPESSVHSPELYAVWAQKAFFVERAINHNPYHTDYFFWCDIGAFRKKSIHPIILNSFPSITYLDSDRIILSSVENMTQSEFIQKKDGICGEKITSRWNKCRIVGGLWGGGIKGCITWRSHYQRMLEYYFNVNRFAGKDQQVMLSAYLADPSIAKIVKVTKCNINPWFFLQQLLSDVDVKYILNPTYIKA
jgi:hypothetical protein